MAAVLALGAVRASAQSKTFTFEDGTDDGWQTGFGGSDAGWPIVTDPAPGNGSKYMQLPNNGSFQVAGYSTGNTSDPFYTAMQAAFLAPGTYQVSYDWYVNPTTFNGFTPTTTSFLQAGLFVNAGSGYYQQDFPGAGKEIDLSGAQLTGGVALAGHVTVPFTIFPADANAATETFFRLGLILNGDSTSETIDFDNISVSPTPEPATLGLLGLAGSALAMRRRRA
ncbi:MAG TPA: PEP-CTERM sorting domain-containing protein [Tepidisphaeraceae bacterium]|jgi:hypothetical protein